jgi:hypothetical protein
MSKVITVSVDVEVEHKFRKVAIMRYGNKKGSLGKALTEAMKSWTEQKSYDPNEHALAMLEKGFPLGKITYKNRAELHER